MTSRVMPAIHDPHPHDELLCNGPSNVNLMNDMATLTFTHTICDAAAALRGEVVPHVIVRARIAMSPANLAAFRDMLNGMTSLPSTPVPLSS